VRFERTNPFSFKWFLMCELMTLRIVISNSIVPARGDFYRTKPMSIYLFLHDPIFPGLKVYHSGVEISENLRRKALFSAKQTCDRCS